MANDTKGAAAVAGSDSNPREALSGAVNAVLSGTETRIYAPNLVGPLSIKALLLGSVVRETGGQRFVVRENSYLVVNRGQPYTFEIDSPKPTTTFSVFFQHGFVEEVHRVLTRPDSALLDLPEGAPPGSMIFRQRLEPEPSEVLAALRGLNAARQCQRERTAVEEGYLRIVRALVLEFPRTEEAVARLSAVRASTREELLRRVLRGRDLLLSQMDESVTIAEAARAACMSRYHFFRTFRRAFGLSPHQFLTGQRLARARVLLRAGRDSVMDVCLECGFQSHASFSLLFRRTFGVSPLEEQRGLARRKAGIRSDPSLEISTFR